MFPKGRLLKPAELDEVTTTIGAGPHDRTLLIEYLHRLQDRFGCLRVGHLQALSQLVAVSMAEVYEVASFYSHFDIVQDGEDSPPYVTVRVCDSISCTLNGAAWLIETLRKERMSNVRVVAAPCMGRCDTAPVCAVGHNHVDKASADKIRERIASNETSPVIPAYRSLAAYREEGGYKTLRDCLAGARRVESVIGELSEGGLRGLGGAGFPTGRKWSLVRQTNGPRLMAVNADEGEPGTFKDRYYLETDPHAFLEGMLIGAWAVEAEAVYIYLRDEYPAVREILVGEIAALERAGLDPHVKIHLRRGAGAYICGEESAMIESIEGKRGLPRHRPPYVAQVGLFGRPTLVNNVETLYWVPQILTRGAGWFASQGKNGAKGLRSYSVSGRVKLPGVKLVPAGTTARELIENHSGGMLVGHRFKGYLPGGASGGILPASLADEPLEFGCIEKHGCFVGSHAVVVFSDRDSVREIALNLMRFFEEESCGQCTPCRSGTEKACKLMDSRSWDVEALQDLAAVMIDASICGLGQAAPNPLLSALRHFPEELQ